jgi:hypothetical protein
MPTSLHSRRPCLDAATLAALLLLSVYPRTAALGTRLAGRPALRESCHVMSSSRLACLFQ